MKLCTKKIIMYGIKNDSKIIRLKRPETKIGRNRTNHVILAKSLKISRHHAVIKFFEDIPFIKDELSEWGIYINGIHQLKNRWVELKVGDIVAFGAPTVEDSGCITEIVDLEPAEDEPSDWNNVATQAPTSTIEDNRKLETIDMTRDEVIDLEVDENRIQDDGRIFSQPSASSAAEPKINGSKTSPVNLISDDDDDDEISFSFLDDAVTSNDEKPAQTSRSTAESSETTPAPLDVTSTMNGLLKSSPIEPTPLLKPPAIPSTDKIKDQLAALMGQDTPLFSSPIHFKVDVKPAVPAKLPIVKEETYQDTQELRNVLNYSMPDEIISLDSDEEDFPSSQMNMTCVTDIPDYSSTFSMMYELKSEEPSDDEDALQFISSDSWFEPLSQTVEDVKSEMSKTWRKPESVSDPVEVDFSVPMDIEQPSDEIDESMPTESTVVSSDNVEGAESTLSTSVEQPFSSSKGEIQKSIFAQGPLLKKACQDSPKIAVIQPLPNKRYKRRSADNDEKREKKRKHRTDSPDSIHRRLNIAENKSHEKKKKSSRRSSSSSSRKEMREKVKALYPEPPKEDKKEPKENKTLPKVKVTTKNRGDFLTKLDPIPSTSSSSPKANKTDAEPSSSKTPEPEPIYKPKIKRISHDSGQIPVITSENHSVKIPALSPTANDEIPVHSSKTPFPKLPITSSSKTLGKPILKKSIEPKLMYESIQRTALSKKVKFPDRIISGCKEIAVYNEVTALSSWKKNEALIRDCLNEFNNALSVILSWNVKWLQEQQKHSEPPPLYPNMYRNGNIVSAVDKYREDLKNSMFHLVWKQIFANWNQPNNDTLPFTQDPNFRDYYTIEIEKVEEVSKDPSNSLLMIFAKSQTLDTSICIGKLSILNFHITKSSPENQTKTVPTQTKTMVFAYINSYNKSFDNMGRVCYRISLKICTKPFHIVRGVAKMKILNYARGHLKQFQAFGMTKTCPIINAICDADFHDVLNQTNVVEIKPKPVNKFSRVLYPAQKKAISVTKSCFMKESSVNFVDGPFGTGKTQFIVALVHELYNSNINDKILIITVNDKLADDLVYRICRDDHVKNVLRFGNCQGVNNNVKHCTFESKVAQFLNTEGKNLINIEDEIKIVRAKLHCNKFLSELKNVQIRKEDICAKIKQCEKEIEDLVCSSNDGGLNLYLKALENSPVLHQMKQQMAKEKVVENANVIITAYPTCWSSMFENYFVPNSLNKGDITTFKICIIDDANFHDENAMLIPQMLQIPHLVLVGDRKVKSYPNSPYHKMLHYFNSNNKEFITCLDEDHRMHPDVSAWVRDYFKLNMYVKVPLYKRKSTLKPFIIIDHFSSQFDNQQAILCYQLVQCILEIEAERPQVGLSVMVAKSTEKERLRVLFTESNIQNRVRVDHYDGFSTRENDIVVLCLPSSRIFDQWLYIAMTRAKSTIIICGDFNEIEPVPAIASLLEYGKNNKVYYSIRSRDLMTPEKIKNILAL